MRFRYDLTLDEAELNVVYRVLQGHQAACRDRAEEDEGCRKDANLCERVLKKLGASARAFEFDAYARAMDLPQNRQQRYCLGTDSSTGHHVVVYNQFGGGAVVVAETQCHDVVQRVDLGNRVDESFTLQDGIRLLAIHRQLPMELGADEHGRVIRIVYDKAFKLYGVSCDGVKVPVPQTYNDPRDLPLPEARELIAQARERREKKIVKRFENSKIHIAVDHFATKISDGNRLALVPHAKFWSKLSLEECEQMLRESAERQRTRKQRRTSAGTGADGAGGGDGQSA